MTESEARAILLKNMEKGTDHEYPHAWVGNLIAENNDSFCFEAGIYAEGEDPREDCGHWGVVKADGRCVLDME